MTRSLIATLARPTIEDFARTCDRQGFTSTAAREAILNHKLVREEVEAAHKRNPGYGHREVAYTEVVQSMGKELRRKDHHGLRIYVNILVSGEGQRYVPFRSLRLAEVMIVIEQTEREKVQRERKLYRLGKFRERLEQCPANTTVGDVYDEVVRDLAA